MDKQRVHRVVRDITPPVVWRKARSIADRSAEYEYAPEGFATHADAWEPGDSLEMYRAKWPAFVNAVEGTGPLAVNHEASIASIEAADDPYAHNLLMSFAYVLARTAHKQERISLLDWGGSLGHYLLVARAVLPDVGIDYHCRDLPYLTALGRQLLPEASFHDDDSCLSRRYDLVLVSGSLHYSPHWEDMLARLASATEQYLYVTRVKTALSKPSFVVVHHARTHGYHGDVPSWVINRDELVAAAGRVGLQLCRSFRLADGPSIARAPESPVREQGFLFSAPSAP